MNQVHVDQLIAALTVLLNAAADRAEYARAIKPEYADAHNGQIIAYQNAIDLIRYYAR